MSFALATTAIVVVTVIFSYRGFNAPWFRDKYTFRPTRILWDRQFYRLLSGGFLHLNWLHLLFNMLSLYVFGETIERVYGIPTFLLIYLGSVVGGSLLSLYLHRHDEGYQALGASGGVCGILFAYVFLFPGTWIYLFMLIPVPSWVYAIGFILVTFFALRNRWRDVGHDAHAGGAIVGLLITTALRPSIVLRSPFLYAVVMGLFLILFLDLYRHPLYVPRESPFRRAYWKSRWAEVRARRRAARERRDRETLDRLLAKISRSGLESLTVWEKRKLKGISKRMRESGRIH